MYHVVHLIQVFFFFLCRNEKGRLNFVSERIKLVYISVKSKLQHPPPPGIPRAFDTFAVLERREFDYQSLPGGGEFDPHA